MPFFKSLPQDGGLPNVFTKYPEIYGPWSTMSEALMNGPSPLSQGERELIPAYAARVAGCKFVYGAHSEVAYAWGIENGVLDRLLDDSAGGHATEAIARIRRKLMQTPSDMAQADANAVFAAGWDKQALHDAIAVAARAAFMQRLVEGHGFTPLSREVAAKHAKRRVERGYVNLYPAFREQK
jgi:alkylhydroperoxidase family enzyme